MYTYVFFSLHGVLRRLNRFHDLEVRCHCEAECRGFCSRVAPSFVRVFLEAVEHSKGAANRHDNMFDVIYANASFCVSLSDLSSSAQKT